MIDPKIITFLMVGRQKSFTRAAEMLNLTQPAVTQHIKQLEECYGVNLFNKRGRQIFLTEEGVFFYQYAETLETNEAIFQRKLKNISANIKKYNVGSTLTIGEFVLPPLLSEYKKKHNNMEFIMQVCNCETIVNKLNTGEIDLGIVEGPFDTSKCLYKKFKDDELVLVVSPESELVNRQSIPLDEILRGKLILREKGSGTRAIFENVLEENGLRLSGSNIFMEVGSIGAIKSLVEANLGYTVISKIAITKELEERMLKIVPITDVVIMREFNFLFTENSSQEFVQSFISYLIERH